jgi:ppGpp synthetase/RelA/SpoT-type nucleotidyltranferase
MIEKITLRTSPRTVGQRIRKSIEDSIGVRIYPNSVYNASCHTSDILLAWGTLNTKTEDVRPYYDDREI